MFSSKSFSIKKGLFLVGFLLFFMASVAHQSPQISHIRFIENKGQWQSKVLFKADVAMGAMFLEKDGFTYNFLDPKAYHHGADISKEKDLKEKFKGHAFRVKFRNSNPSVQVSGKVELPEYFNYFIGKDQSKWAADVKAFTRVYYSNIYPSIDLLVYTFEGHIKYDFILKPGADPSVIQMEYEGLDKIKLSKGNLVLETAVGTITELDPVAFQRGRGDAKTDISCSFTVKSNTVFFRLPEGYDQTRELIIDPELIFSTYSGSYANNFGYTATFDSEGFLYAGGTAFGPGYPTTLGAYDRTYNGEEGSGTIDIAISKYDTTGTYLVYSTYVGGLLDEMPHSMIANSNDELFVFGTTGSWDFPTSTNAYRDTFNNDTTGTFNGHWKYFYGLAIYYPYGSDMVVFRLSSSGNALLASSYLGGSGNDGLNSSAAYNQGPLDSLRYNYADEVRGEIDIDRNNNIYLATCTASPDFPMEGNSFQSLYAGGSLDGVVIKMDNNLSNIIWSTYLGGSNDDAIYSLALDDINNVYVAGGTTSPDFPTTADVLKPNFSGGRADGFVSKLNSEGEIVINSTYWGSPVYDQNYFVELDWQNNVHIFGQTEAQDSTFIFNAPYSVPTSGQYVSKISNNLDTLIWSTVFGSGTGKINISPTAFLVDLCDKIYLSGWGGSTNIRTYNNASYTTGMYTTPDAFQSTTDGSDFYLMVLEDDASAISYATFFGGPVSPEHVDGGTSRFDKKGKIYQSVCAGCSENSDFPIKPNPGAVSPINNSSCNNAVFKFDFLLPFIVADFEAPPTVCAPYTVEFRNKSLEQTATTFDWDFGDNSGSTLKNPTHTYTNAGKYEVKLVIRDMLSCNLIDSISKEIIILSDTSYQLSDINLCPGQTRQIGLLPLNDPALTYSWYPSAGLSDSTVSNPFSTPDTTTTYTLLISNGFCTDTIMQTVHVRWVDVVGAEDSIVCSDDPAVTITANSIGANGKYVWSNFADFRDTINSDLSNPSITVTPLLPENFYFIHAENQYGCEDMDTVKVKVSDYSLILDEDKYICLGDSVLINSTNLIPENTLTYTWSPTASIIGRTDSSSIWAKPPTTTTYSLTTINKYGCRYVDSITVYISPIVPGVEYAIANPDTILEGTTSQLIAFPNPNYVYAWTPSGSLNNPAIYNPIASPVITTAYSVTITDPLGDCSRKADVTVHVIPVICDEPAIFIPNAFTPNEDGVNDKIYIRGENIDQFLFIIYDRWGEKVFETTDLNAGWDGSYKERKLDPDVYVYYLEIRCINKKEFFKKGNITLIR